MRVLLLHNRYRAEGGEERAVAETAALLTRRGHAVRVLERSSAELGRARAARALLSGGEDPDEVARAVRAHRAEVVHAHNLHPLYGWRARAAARAQGARTVLHLHNFRLFCSIGVAFRDGRPCHDCKSRNTAPGLIHNCRGSRAESAIYTAALSLQQPRLLEHADRICALSDAHAALLHEHGLPDQRVSVVPNFVADFAAPQGGGEHVLVSGRLVEEKGFDTAIGAAAAAGVPLVVTGTGPDEPRLRELAQRLGARAHFTGWLPSQTEMARVRSGAAVVLAPSRCEEACPYSVLDALAAGIPVLVSDRGGLPEMVPSGRGLVLPADDPGPWAETLAALWRDRSRRRSCGEAAVQHARGRFGEDAVYARLMDAYGCEP